MILVPGNGTWSHDLIRPTTNFLCSNSTASKPWSHCRGFAAGVSELDGDELALRMSKLDGLLERLDLAILPESGVLGSDAAWRWELAIVVSADVPASQVDLSLPGTSPSTIASSTYLPA